MAIIISISENKPVYNQLAPTEEERKKASEFHTRMKLLIPELEKEFEKGKRKTKKGFTIDDKVAYEIGKKLKHVICDKYAIPEDELADVFKAIRRIYCVQGSVDVSKRRDTWRYMFEASKLPLEFYRSIGWDGWRRVMESPGVRSEKRFRKWLENKYGQAKSIKRGFMRVFVKQLNSLLNHKDTFIITDDQELFDIYDKAWNCSISHKKQEGSKNKTV